MSYTQADIDALEKSIKSGTLRVRLADQDVTYRSLEEMQAILRSMKQAVGTAPGGGPRFSQASFSEPYGT